MSTHSTAERTVEDGLTVLWQRHLPEGWTPDAAEYIDTITSVGADLVSALIEYQTDIAKGDLVVTLSRRPPLSVTT